MSLIAEKEAVGIEHNIALASFLNERRIGHGG